MLGLAPLCFFFSALFIFSREPVSLSLSFSYLLFLCLFLSSSLILFMYLSVPTFLIHIISFLSSLLFSLYFTLVDRNRWSSSHSVRQAFIHAGCVLAFSPWRWKDALLFCQALGRLAGGQAGS